MTNDDDLERRALELLEAALEKPDEERQAFVDQTAADDEVLRTRTSELLVSLSRSGGQLATGAAGDDAKPPEPPERVGAYRVLELLGQGGMGAVFLGERDVGDFEHNVAIKLVRPGVVSDALINRFARERQILASLAHPNIARLYDGGTLDDGGPYIVMEFIEGEPIDRWADDKALPVEDRLKLIEQVCDAVGFAHQNLIVHRDLTPSNVLVTPDGDPKLIDFGIAKPQEDEITDQDGSGSLVSLSLTPGFAAPERYVGAPATTLTDIYSLGKLMARLTEDCADDPDLVAIIGRATAEEADDRYPTADALSDDIERYLDDYPVEARSGGRRYIFGKFFERNRTGVLAGLVVMALLIGALVTTVFAYSRAEIAREAEQDRFEQLRSLASYMLFDLNGELQTVVGNTAARVTLAEQAQSYLTILADSLDADDTLKLETAQGFVRLALIQGGSGHPNFGEHALALSNLDRAEGILVSLDDGTDGAVGSALAIARAYRSMILLHSEGKPEEAGEQVNLAIRALSDVPRNRRDADWMDARSTVRLAQMESLDLALGTDELTRVAGLMASEIDQWPEDMQQSRRADLDRAIATNYRASALYNTGDEDRLPEALELFEEADRLFAEMEETEPNDPIALYRRGWNAYYAYAAASTIDRMEDAERLLQQGRVSVARLLTIEENDNSLVTFDERLREAQAELFSNTGRHDEAIALQQTIIDGRVAKLTDERRLGTISDLSYGYAILGSIARRASSRQLACNSWRSAEDLMAEVDRRGEIQGYVAELRAGVRSNLQRCARGEPVTSFTALS